MGAVKDALSTFGSFFVPIGGVLRLVARWVLTPALQFAFMLAAITLAYQIAATEMQAEQLAWEVLSSRNSGGHLGKAAALEHLNTDSTWPVPNVPGWFGYEFERREGASFSLNEGGWLRFPIPPLFRGRTDLRGLILSHNVVNVESCTEDSTVLSGLRLQHARLVEADFRCVIFEGIAYSNSRFLGSDSKQNGVDFSEAQLQRAKFSGAKLKFAKFNDAMLFKSEFDHANVFRAQFNGASGVRALMLNLSVEHTYANLSDDERSDGVNAHGKTLLSDSSPGSSGELVKSKTIVGSQNFCSQDICFIAACFDRSMLQFKPPQRGEVAVAFRGASLQHATLSGQVVNADFGPLTAEDRLAIENKRFHACEPTQRLAIESGNSNQQRVVSPKKRDITVEGADLTGANLQFTDWAESDFTGSIFAKTQLAGANLRFARGLTAEMLLAACIDEYTLLPTYVNITPKTTKTRTLIKSINLKLSSCDGATSEPDKLNDCKVETLPMALGFRGTIEQMKNEILFIKVAGCENLVRFKDVALTRTLSSIGARGNDARGRAARELASKLTGRNLGVKCVRFSKPHLEQSNNDTGTPDPDSREELRKKSEKPRLNPVLEGWCAASPDQTEWISLIEAIKMPSQSVPRTDSAASVSNSSTEAPEECTKSKN